MYTRKSPIISTPCFLGGGSNKNIGGKDIQSQNNILPRLTNERSPDKKQVNNLVDYNLMRMK